MSQKKKAVRDAFRTAVLSRDKHRCNICGKAGYDRQGAPEKGKVALDVHHIQDRTNDNYTLENGISLCDDCHLKAERFHLFAGRKPLPTLVGWHVSASPLG